MTTARTLAICAFGIVVFAHGLEGQGLSRYRNFELGSDLTTVSALAGVAPSEAKTIHQRPAVLQDLEWRPSHWISGSTIYNRLLNRRANGPWLDYCGWVTSHFASCL